MNSCGIVLTNCALNIDLPSRTEEEEDSRRGISSILILIVLFIVPP